MAYDIPFLPNVKGCVYKLWYADKYVVVKCKYFPRSRQNISVGLKYFFQNTPQGRKQSDRYFLFYSHVLHNPFNSFTVELVLASDNPYELLKAEQSALDAGKNDEKCLNNGFEAYIPENTQVNGKGSWINRGYYLNFHQWKNKSNQNKNE